MTSLRTTRPGFALAYVLLLVVVASVMIAAGLMRTGAQARVTQRRVDGYHEYHELMSIVDTIDFWATAVKNPSDVIDMARNGGERATIRLRDDLRLQLRISDAQGTVLARLDRSPDQERTDWLLRTLELLGPENIDRYTRKAGSFQISFNAAEEPVLAAVADGNGELFNALLTAHAQRPETSHDFEKLLQNQGVDVETTRALSQRFFTFSPSVLRIDAVLYSPFVEEERYYTILMELRGGEAYFYEWKKLKSIPSGRRGSTT